MSKQVNTFLTKLQTSVMTEFGPKQCTHTCIHTCTPHPLNASIWTVCTAKTERKKCSEACPKKTVKIVYWQSSDCTRKVLEAVNRKWLSKSRWSMLTAGTKQEIAERLNGCKKKALLLSPWQSQYAHCSCSQSSSTTLISPSYKVLQSANTFCLSNALALNFRTSARGLEGKAYVLLGRQRKRGTHQLCQGWVRSTQCLPEASGAATVPLAAVPGALVPSVFSTILNQRTTFLPPHSF